MYQRDNNLHFVLAHPGLRPLPGSRATANPGNAAGQSPGPCRQDGADLPARKPALVRDLRAGKLTVFAPPGVPGRKSAPKKDAARGRVIGLRRAGLSVYEISIRLTSEGTPLGRSAVSDILREEGFGRLVRGPAPEASTSPATSRPDPPLPAAAVTDFAALPARTPTTMARLLLAIPALGALDLPALVSAPGCPRAPAVPPV